MVSIIKWKPCMERYCYLQSLYIVTLNFYFKISDSSEYQTGHQSNRLSWTFSKLIHVTRTAIAESIIGFPLKKATRQRTSAELQWENETEHRGELIKQKVRRLNVHYLLTSICNINQKT